MSSTSCLLNQDASIKASKPDLVGTDYALTLDSPLTESSQTAAVTPSLWTTEDVCSWASSLGLKQAHVKKLLDNEITGTRLVQCLF
jgi:hypothetical protein